MITPQLTERLDDLDELIASRPGRSQHFLADLALKMFAVQVLQYGRAVQHLIEAGFNSWSFSLARVAFETAEDLAYLAFAPDQDEYGYLGALAVVGAEVAVSKANDLAQSAGAQTGLPKLTPSRPERDRIRLVADQWEAGRPGATEIVNKAYSATKVAWKKGTKHWTTLSRQNIHEALSKRLADSKLYPVLICWYDILASRSHPGLHSPQIKLEDGQVTLFTDGDRDHPVPAASVKFAVEFATASLRHQFELSEAGGNVGGASTESTT